jgi:hypothetical protein
MGHKRKPLTRMQLGQIELKPGKHATPESGLSLMEAVAWFDGQEHTTEPKNVSTVLSVYGQGLNDAGDDTHRNDLKQVIPMIRNSYPDISDVDRLLMVCDWLTRSYVPRWLDRAGIHDHADWLRTNEPLRTVVQALAVQPQLTMATDACSQLFIGKLGAETMAEPYQAARIAQKAIGWAQCTAVDARRGQERLAAGKEIIRRDPPDRTGDQTFAGQVLVPTKDPRFADIVTVLQEETLDMFRRIANPEEVTRFKMIDV